MNKYPRPKSLPNQTTRIETGCGHMYVTICFAEDGMPIEVFARLGKAGGCTIGFLEGLTRAITLGLKYGVPLDEYVKQLENIRCPHKGLDEGVWVLSCVDGIAKALEVVEYDKKTVRPKSQGRKVVTDRGKEERESSTD